MADESTITVATPAGTFKLGWFNRYCRQDQAEDPKRYGVMVATITLATAFSLLVLTIIGIALAGKTLDNGLLTFTGGVGFTLGALAGATHRKPDDPLPSEMK